MNEQTRNLAAKIAFLILLGLLVIAFLAIVRPFAVPALFALIVVIIAEPIHARLVNRLGKRRYLAAAIMTFAVSLCVIVPLALVLWVVIANAAGLVSHVTQEIEKGSLTQAIAGLDHWLDAKLAVLGTYIPINIGDFNLRAMLLDALKSTSKVVQYTPKVLGATANLGSSFLLTVIFVFVFFVEGTRIYGTFIALLPLSADHKAVLDQEVRSVLTGTFLGLVATAFAQGALIGIGYWIIGVKNALLWALAGVAISMVPVIGGPLMYVPACVVMVLTGHWGKGLFILLYGVLIVSSVDNIIKPLVMHGKVDVHPVLLAISLIGGGLWLGPAGIVVGPLVVALLLSMLRTYRREFL